MLLVTSNEHVPSRFCCAATFVMRSLRMGTSGPRNPTAIKRWFVFTLRQLREAQGLSRNNAAQAIRGTVKTLEHIELGRRLPTPLQLDKLLEIYAVPERRAMLETCGSAGEGRT